MRDCGTCGALLTVVKRSTCSPIFWRLLDKGLVQPKHKVMCIGARLGQEVVAFQEIGVADAIGIDLVPAPPLVIHGDIRHHPFPDSTFGFEFSNVFDHALFPQRFVSEIERTLKPSGKAYPKQGHNFTVYAIEADHHAFRQSYINHTEVNFMPFAAWVRNETLMFGSDSSGTSFTSRHVGMGRIHQHVQSGTPKLERDQLIEVQGIDIAEWIRSVASEDDFVVVKMDVEGAEYELLPRLMTTGVICLVDELFLECHYNRWQHCCPERTTKYNRTYQDCVSLFRSLRQNGVLVHQWW
ncbi:hypothetical protein M758_1G066600 [Ceratodon purpureus]|nr:hypothetical protein M758_1G066200 [Ceratodon purpureus]KAG0628968.1 hypothetical protein M758_1G066600 [Ceratodon purpureus]